MSGAKRLVLLFALTILLPGVLLAVLAARALYQERHLVEQEWQGRLDRIAGDAARNLARDLDQWTVSSRDIAALPPTLRRGLERGAVAVRLESRSGRAGWPPEALAHIAVTQLPKGFPTRYREAAAESPGRPARALELLSEISAGKWQMEQPRYLFYRDQLLGWASTDPALESRSKELAAVLKRREDLTAAVLDDTGTSSERFIQFGSRTDRAATLVLERRWVEDVVRNHLLAALGGDERFAVLARSDAATVASTSAQDSAPRDGRMSSRTVRAPDLLWTIEVWPVNLDAVAADIRRRYRLYLAILGGVLLFLTTGSYLTARVVRREMEVARMKSDFVAAVSHEFRSPLTGIRQLSEMLVRGRIPNEARRQEYYERIALESDRLSGIVENLLDFARMEDQRYPYRFERVPAHNWLDEMTARLKTQEALRSHPLIVEIERNLPHVRIDPEAMATAVGNLVSNAAKYSADGTRVWVDANQDESGVVIRVRDEGVGIPVTDQPHVFDRFYRGSQASSVPGTGLGLSLVRHIIEAHGGKLHLLSQPGAGTTVSIHLKADA